MAYSEIFDQEIDSLFTLLYVKESSINLTQTPHNRLNISDYAELVFCISFFEQGLRSFLYLPKEMIKESNLKSDEIFRVLFVERFKFA